MRSKKHMNKRLVDFDKILVDFVKDALLEYEEQVEKTDLKRSAKDTYIVHAQQFVRWLDGEFTPGVRVTTPLERAVRSGRR